LAATSSRRGEREEQMFSAIKELMYRLPLLKRKKNPNLAGFFGFMLGGFGIGLYLWSFIDFVLAFGSWIAVWVVLLQGLHLNVYFVAFCNSLFQATYGYFRVLSSNETLSARQRRGPIS
jgi:hypothetical protein